MILYNLYNISLFVNSLNTALKPLGSECAGRTRDDSAAETVQFQA